MKKLFKWIELLLSDSKFASTRRFIGLQSFYCLITIIIFAIFTKTKFANIVVISQSASYLFTIVMCTIVGTTITDLVSTIKASQFPKEPTSFEDEFNNLDEDKPNFKP